MTVPNAIILLVSILLASPLLLLAIVGETRRHVLSWGVRLLALGGALIVAFVCGWLQGWIVP
jgi:hypothetical protein